MSDISSRAVSFGKCGKQLDEKTGLPKDQRSLCPACGSYVRTNAVIMTIATKALSSLKGIGRRAGLSRSKGWFIEVLVREVLQCNRGYAVADHERTIDREGDRYTEKVTLRDRGEVIHLTDEPLSKHKGHGSDKRKK